MSSPGAGASRRGRAAIRVVVAPDSFKGSLTAAEAARAMAAGVADGWPGAEVVPVPLADGGEGTAAALVAATGGQMRTARVTGPLGAPVRAAWGLLGDGETAVVEMAAASGLLLVRPGRRNPMHATTRGTGELIRAALDAGCRRLIIGIGGSATHDGGVGMAAALGARFLRADGTEIGPGAAGLLELDRVDLSGLDPRLRQVEIRVACDVDNPLTGPRGAAMVYAPQKGARPDQLPLLDAALERLAAVVRRDLGLDLASVPGAGAAGGMGYGLIAFLGARLEPGVELVMAAARIDDALRGAHLALTGEGRTDAQTLAGKVPLGLARRAAAHGVPTVVIAGSLGPGHEALLDAGVAALFSIAPGPVRLSQLVGEAGPRLRAVTAHVMRLFRLGAGVGSRL